MRERRSADESPRVGRDYLRSDEANAVIEAAGRVGRQRLLRYTKLAPGRLATVRVR